MGIALKQNFPDLSPLTGLISSSWAENPPSQIGGEPGLTPILRWAGSKKRIIPQLLQMIPDFGGCYYEPFLGSATLFLALQPKQAILSDLNSQLIQAYTSIKSHPEKIWQLLMEMPDSSDFYYSLRNLKPSDLSLKERVARFVYLNRFCFNGVYRTNLNGEFNVARGRGNLGIPNQEVFNTFAERLKPAKVLSSDFEIILAQVGEQDFIYIDPPYLDLSKRNRGEYGSGSFNHHDVERLVKSIHAASGRGAKILISYRYCEDLIRQFPSWHLQILDVKRSVSCESSTRASAKEILLTNYTL